MRKSKATRMRYLFLPLSLPLYQVSFLNFSPVFPHPIPYSPRLFLSCAVDLTFLLSPLSRHFVRISSYYLTFFSFSVLGFRQPSSSRGIFIIHPNGGE